MSRGIIYPPYDVPTGSPHGLGPLGEAVGPTAIAAIAPGGPYFDGMAARYWAALTSVAGSRAMLRASGAGARAEAAALWDAPHVIDQHDTLMLHRPARVENPFAGLIEHRLHIHLDG